VFASSIEHVIILKSNGQQAAVIVDKIIGQFEGVLKDMGSQLKHVENITGLTMLGNGKLVPVINVAELLKNAGGKTSLITPQQSESDSQDVKHRILVAEDSITIRTMLRSYLESAGYIVKTAVDGYQAYQFLQQSEYDLVVSDVEMPRMNGFELTAKIRETTAYAQLPVILVTALETPDDKQRGLEAGANAYIVKRNFEQSNLVDTIKRLL
jgi:two-component system chemotaxis sensor kinase CheA